MAKILEIYNFHNGEMSYFTAPRWELVGDMAISYDNEYSSKVTGYTKIQDHTAVQIRESTPDEKVIQRMYELDDEQMATIKNFMVTAGLMEVK